MAFTSAAAILIIAQYEQNITMVNNSEKYIINSEIPFNGVLIAVNYTSDNVLMSIDTKRLENVSEYEVEIDKDAADITKLMLWNNIENMRPLLNSVVLQ